MRFFSLDNFKVVPGIDVSNYPHGDDLRGAKTVKAGSFRLIAPGHWNIEPLLDNIRHHEPFDQFLYCDIRLSATDSTTTLLPADCFLIELPFPGTRSLYEHGDTSMPLLVRKGFALFICFAGHTVFKLDDTHYLVNKGGKPTIVDEATALNETTYTDEYVLEF